MENCAADLLEWSSAAANVAENTVPSSRTATRLASLMLLFISLSSDEFLCSWSGGRAGTDFWNYSIYFATGVPLGAKRTIVFTRGWSGIISCIRAKRTLLHINSGTGEAMFSATLQHLGDAVAGVPVPQRRHNSLLRIPAQDFANLGGQPIRVLAHQDVGAQSNRDGTLRVLS